MAELNNDKDDLADALARLADGAASPSEREHETAPQELPQPVTPARSPAVRPAAVRPAVIRPTAPQVARPVAPSTASASAAPSTPPAPTTSPIPSRPARPAALVVAPSRSDQDSAPTPASPSGVRPIAPALASGSGAGRKPRPSAPTIRQNNDPDVDGDQSTGITAYADNSQQIIDDDDSVIVPAPDASVFNAKPKSTAEVRAKIQAKKQLEFRRTMIPILLTTGTMLLIFGLLKFVTGPESMLTNLPNWIPLVLLAASAVLLSLAAVNMLSVKQQLRQP